MDIKKFLLDTVINKHEKGYQNDPRDNGNWTGGKRYKGSLIGTNFGISAPLLKDMLGHTPTAQEVQSLTKEKAVDVYYNRFYKKYGIDKLPENMQANVLDMRINSGHGVKILQKALGVKADGHIGKNTLDALSKTSFDTNTYSDIRNKYYTGLADHHRHLHKWRKGWLRRSNSFRTEPTADQDIEAMKGVAKQSVNTPVEPDLISQITGDVAANEVLKQAKVKMPIEELHKVVDVKKHFVPVEDLPENNEVQKPVDPRVETQQDDELADMEENDSNYVLGNKLDDRQAAEPLDSTMQNIKPDDKSTFQKFADMVIPSASASEMNLLDADKAKSNKKMVFKLDKAVTELKAKTTEAKPVVTNDYTGRKEYEAEHNTNIGGWQNTSNNVLNNGILGKLIDKAEIHYMSEHKVDPNYNPQDDKNTFDMYTKGLDNDQLERLLDGYSNNQDEFLKGAMAMQEYNKRSQEISEYTQAHPVLGTVQGLTPMLTDAALFMGTAAVMEGASSAIMSESMLQAGILGKAAYYALPELMINGGIEGTMAATDSEYKFNPTMFMGAMALGSSFRAMAHMTGSGVIEDIQKVAKDMKGDRGSFSWKSVENEDEFIKAVSEHATEAKAKDLAVKLVERKRELVSSIHEGLVDTVDLSRKNLVEAKELGNRKAIRRAVKDLNKAEIDLKEQGEQLINNTHPQVNTDLQTRLSYKQIGKELGIEEKHLSSNEALRKYLGINSPDVVHEFDIAGEKPYMKVVNKNLHEMSESQRINSTMIMNHTADKIGNLIGDDRIEKGLHTLLNTDGMMNRVLTNTGNLVNSDNELVSSFYNMLGSDAMGRTGASKIRGIESQQKYSRIYGSNIMNAYQSHGEDLYRELLGAKSAGEKVAARAKAIFKLDDFENKIEPLFNDRVRLGAEEFKNAHPELSEDALSICDKFNKDYIEGNKQILADAKRAGVKGFEEATEDFKEDHIHSQWDSHKARAIPREELEQGIYDGMLSKLKSLGVEMTDEAELRKEAGRFAAGVANKDVTEARLAQKQNIAYLRNIANSSADDTVFDALNKEIKRVERRMANGAEGDMAHRALIDMNVELKGGGRLSDLLEDNFISTQRRFNDRMAAKVAAAEQGISNIDDLDEWVEDAYQKELKRLTKLNVDDPKGKAEWLKDAMQGDLKAFKFGAGAGKSIEDQNLGNVLRLANKYNFARLMQNIGISSIAEVGNGLSEMGSGQVFKEYRRSWFKMAKEVWIKHPDKAEDILTREMQSITGIGWDDYSYSTVGTAKSERIYHKGLAHKFEQFTDVTERMTKGTLSGIETVNRRLMANSMATQWADHFKGNDIPSSFIGDFFSSKSKDVTKRVLENVDFGAWEGDTFKFNERYESVKKNMLAHAKYDAKGRLEHLNIADWEDDARHAFADVVTMQSHHIMVDATSELSAKWEKSVVGKLVTTYRAFSRNATTKILGYQMANAHVGHSHGDNAEYGKLAGKMFWGSVLGALSISVRQNMDSTGDGKGLNTKLFDDGAAKALGIGFARSSMIGNWDGIIDTALSGMGQDPLFQQVSSYGRSRSIFDVGSTPVGQLAVTAANAASNVAQGKFKKAGMSLLKMTPMARQLGIRQVVNLINQK